MRGIAALRTFGFVLIGIGVLAVAFSGFMIFGTAYIQRAHQATLRQHLEPVLAPSLGHIETLGPPRTATTRLQPANGVPIADLRIAAIQLNMVVVQGTDEQDLEDGPGHYLGTPLPGEAGNVGIAGHRTTWARPFWDLNELHRGDTIVLTTNTGVFTYSVTGLMVVAPTDVGVLDQGHTNTLTLTTCTPRFSAAQRLVARAVLTSSSLTPTRDIQPLPTFRLVTSTTEHSDTTAILLGLVTLAGIVITVIVGSRIRRTFLAYVVGTPVVLVLLVLTFSHAAPLLPANF